MKQWKRLWICGVALMLTFLLIPGLSAAASNGWTELGNATETAEGIILTESVRNQDGAYAKEIPVGTKNGFTLSFDYLITSGGTYIYDWIEIPFSDQPFNGAKFPVGYTQCYGIMIGRNGIDIYNTSAYSEEHYEKTPLPSGATGKAAHVDNTWHSVAIRYADGKVEVYDSNELVVSCTSFLLPDMVYTGFVASTASALGAQRHVVRNVRIEGAPDACLVHLDANGGSCDTNTVYVLSGGQGNLPEAQREGYVFNGWYEESSCVTRVDEALEYVFKQNQTLYAGWTPCAVAVTFDPCAGDLTKSTKTVYYQQTYGQLPTLSRSGYRFDGWQDSYGTDVNSETLVTRTDSHTLYAKWTEIPDSSDSDAQTGDLGSSGTDAANTSSGSTYFTVRFNAGKGSVSKKSRKVEKWDSVGRLPTPKRKKYTFLGWYTKKSGGKKISSISIVTKDTVYYAHWVKSSKKITIKLKKNGGSCSKTSIKVKYGGKMKGLPTPSRKGYKFLGWYTKKIGGRKVKSSTKVIDILPVKKLYAHWSKKSSGSLSSGLPSGGLSSGLSSGSSSGSGSGSSWSGLNSGKSCTYCGGKGYRNCLTCGGTGWVESYTSTPNYSGSPFGGGSSTSTKPCPNAFCNGGHVDCPYC